MELRILKDLGAILREVEIDNKEASRSREDKSLDLRILNELAGTGILGQTDGGDGKCRVWRRWSRTVKPHDSMGKLSCQYITGWYWIRLTVKDLTPVRLRSPRSSGQRV